MEGSNRTLNIEIMSSQEMALLQSWLMDRTFHTHLLSPFPSAYWVYSPSKSFVNLWCNSCNSHEGIYPLSWLQPNFSMMAYLCHSLRPIFLCTDPRDSREFYGKYDRSKWVNDWCQIIYFTCKIGEEWYHWILSTHSYDEYEWVIFLFIFFLHFHI